MYKENLFFTGCMLITLPPSTVLQLHILNIAMKYYDQMEVIPIY